MREIDALFHLMCEAKASDLHLSVGTTPFLQHKCPGRLKWIGRPLGYDNEEVYQKLLGLGSADLSALKKSGVI